MSTTPLGFRISTELLLEYHENLREGHDLAYYNLETEQLNGTGIRPKDQTLTVDDSPNHIKDLLAFSTATSSSSSSISAAYEDDEDHKASKPHRLSSPPSIAPHKFIHVIPILILLCFLILFLFSHIPSKSDLAQFNGFTKLPRSAKHVGTQCK
ncbi:hypothetical protein D8674_005811 [Pyrus ussuriensis x Pyrus communis]|uniref:Uncharacterized protein n=1 Tax=Pyrus ussuriensis x Pyrus communis TaxID=2448454 RepID=A0A5N5G675_9ROSA|nr:hypothetical protein D8674_005811 [Pyrus ussuriensis x Pyrus communis]